MTNEEIIKTTATAFFNDALPNTPLPNGIGILISDVLKLKEQQFKEYLEKRKALYEGKVSAVPAAIVIELNEIINKLFGE